MPQRARRQPIHPPQVALQSKGAGIGAPSGYWRLRQLTTFRDKADSETLMWSAALRLTLSGFRRSEVLGLTWDAVDLQSGTVEVRQGRVALADGSTTIGAPKSRASARIVPIEALHPGTVAMLEQLRDVQAGSRAEWGDAYEESDLVIVNALGGAPRPEALSDRFQAVAAKAELPRIRLHEIRHSLATALAANPNVADIDAAALLGHDVAVFHARYAQRSHDAAARAAAALGASFVGETMSTT